MTSRRTALTAVAAAAVLLLGTAAAHAGGVVSTVGSGTDVATMVVTLDADSPTSGNPCFPDDAEAFETVTMTVSASGQYSFREEFHRGYQLRRASYYELPTDGSGVPDCAGIEVSESGPFVELRSGVTYVLVLQDPVAGPPERHGLVATAVDGTVGTVTFDGVVDTTSPSRVGDHEVTGNGTTLAVIDYTLDGASRTSSRFPVDRSSPCDEQGSLPGQTPYETVRMQVSLSGDYRARSLLPSGSFDVFGFAAVHEGEVDDPDGPGCIETTSSQETVTLQAGTTYTLFLAGVDRTGENPTPAIGRQGFAVAPDDDVDGRVTFLSAAVEEIDEAVVCAPGGEVPAGYVVVEGSSRNDTLVGTSGNDVIRGLGGNDTIRGLGGDDILCGGAGNDALEGGAGEDVLFGGAGNDSSSGGADDDVLVDAAGNDRLDGGAGSDVGFDRVGNNTFLRIESRELPDGIVAR